MEDISRKEKKKRRIDKIRKKKERVHPIVSGREFFNFYLCMK